MTQALDYAKANAAHFRAQLYDFLRIPSVSTDPEYQPEVKRAADWLVEDLKQIGLQVELLEMPERHPLIYAEWLGAGSDAKTVLIYGHYDVQPAVVEDGWDTPPFEPTEKDGFVYARGATDDKGQMFAHVKAVEAVLKSEGKLPCNIKLIFEGEEESGGRHLAHFIKTHGSRLNADVCVVSDGSMMTIDQPIISNALRGIMTMEVLVQGPAQDLHSGMYGGTVHNPLQALAEILAQLHHADGSVAVPGFYDNVLTLTPQERKEIAAVPWETSEWQKETGAPQPWGEADFSLNERIGARPTLEINGMAGGFYGNGFKTVLPAKAMAKISCRLVANQDPQKIQQQVMDYIRHLAPPTVMIEFKQHGMGQPVLVKTDTPVMQAAIQAYQKGWGAAPLFKREGGSIPVVADVQNTLGIPVILMGFGLNSDGLHGPNEHFSLTMFHKAIDTSIHFLYEMAQQG
jgi:acetylornithine deacetylase/succinyl-diaminopimelate desuccinylase-like protein